MIELCSVAKVYPGKTPKVLIGPVDIVIPTDRRLAILGDPPQMRSLFLNLLAGTELPSRGAVSARVSLSPVFRYGVLFQRRLSVMQNIQFFARMMNVDAAQLLVLLNAFHPIDKVLAGGVKLENVEQRRAAEIGLLTLLPFQCYLFDELWLISGSVRERFFRATEERGSGIIFATNHVRLAREHADCAIVVRGGTVYPFSDVDEGIAFHEHR